MSLPKPTERSLADPTIAPVSNHKQHTEFEALFFSSIDSNLAGSFILNPPTRLDTKHHYEARRSRQDSKVSHRASLHRSSSLVFKTLPPIRRMPSLQIPSLTDITNPHNISAAPRSLHLISETEATSYKRKLPLTLVHPNSPYVPWEAPLRQKILCQTDVPPEEHDLSAAQDGDKRETSKDAKAKSNLWKTLKTAPRTIKHKCQRLLNPRSKGQTTAEDPTANPTHPEDITVSLPGIPLSPTASLRSTDTNTLAIWLSERRGKQLDKDCESSKLMTIDEYERVGSWIKPGDRVAFSASRISYQHSFADEDTVSSVFIFENDGDMSPVGEHSPFYRPSPLPQPGSPGRLGSKRLPDEERLSRLVHRASVRPFLAERPISTPNVRNISHLAS